MSKTLFCFLDLAYDFDKWGTTAPNKTEEYTKQWIATQFGSRLTVSELDKAYQIIDGYTRLNSIRKPEALSPDTYHPVHYGEADWALSKAEEIETLARELKDKITASCDKMTYVSFYELLCALRRTFLMGASP